MTSTDSSLVALYKKVCTAYSSPGAAIFEDVISPAGSFNTNGTFFDYTTFKAISELFFSSYTNVELSFSEFVEAPKTKGKEGEGTVAATVHWQGDYTGKEGGRDEFRSHTIMHIELGEGGKQMVTQIYEITNYQDTHRIFG